MSNCQGEWCVAYHGFARFQPSDNVKIGVRNISTGEEFRPGANQGYAGCDDACHPGQKVGSGVYCTPKINIAEGYAGTSIINGVGYKTVFMVRVKPDSIRYSASCSDYWVVSGKSDEIRPYRILYKKA